MKPDRDIINRYTYIQVVIDECFICINAMTLKLKHFAR